MSNKMYDPLTQYTKVQETPSIFKRSLAFLVDIGILSMTILAPVTSLLEKMIPEADFSASYALLTGNEKINSIVSVSMVFVFALIVCYFSILEYVFGQTAGKRLMKLQVVDINGKEPGLIQCIVRNMVFLPVFPFILFWIIDPVYMLLTKQTLSDQLTKTKTVVKL